MVKRSNVIRGIPKLDDANWAGTAKSNQCTLILTEGDSAKALAIAGLSVIGRDKYGVFPLKGKMLNVREATAEQKMKNAEINALKKILGLQMYESGTNKPKEYKDTDELRYGHVMLFTDQDVDGFHIKGLVINFFHTYWPSLLGISGFIQTLGTPIVKVTKGKQIKSFHTLAEYENWKSNTLDYKKWYAKYYKGLGTSTSKEAKEYFKNMTRI